MKVLSVFLTLCRVLPLVGRTLQLTKLTALCSIYDQNQLNLTLAQNVASFDVIYNPGFENYYNLIG
jgi:hypothetical protein